MKPLCTAGRGLPIEKLRFHPRERLLASVVGAGEEVHVWRWDDSGLLEVLLLIRQPDGARVRDLAWSPTGAILAVAAAGRAVELWSVAEGRLIREVGDRPDAPRTIRYDDAYDAAYPVEDQGYGNVAFAADGKRLVAGVAIEERTEIFRVDSGERVGSFWGTDTAFALHPEGEILATLSSDQMATAVRFGRLTDVFQGYDIQLYLDYDGYARLVFSPRGNHFAVIGHAYAVGVQIYSFPSCRALFNLDFETWDELCDALNDEARRQGLSPPESDGDPSPSFPRNLGTMNDRLAFHPDGSTLLFGTALGTVVGVGLDDTSKPSGIWVVHDGPVLALDASWPHAILATGHLGGEIRLWTLDPTAPPSHAGRPMTAAFLETARPLDPSAPAESFRTTDGTRWYDFENLDTTQASPTEPPWVQVARLSSWKDRPSS